MLQLVKIKTRSKQKGHFLMVKAQRTDKKPIASNHFANILDPFLSTGKKVAKIKVNTHNGRFSAVLIPKT